MVYLFVMLIFLSPVHIAELCSVQYCYGFSLYPSVCHMLVFES